MRRERLILATVVLIISSIACTTEDEFASYESQLKTANEIWEASGIDDYQFHFFKSIDNSLLLMNVSVIDGELSTVTDLISEESLEVNQESATTLDGLFDYARSIIHTMKFNDEIQIENLNVTYDNKLGYLKEINYEYSNEEAELYDQYIVITTENFVELGK